MNHHLESVLCNPTLLGFSDEIHAFDAWLNNPDSIGLFVSGRAGCGKTHLMSSYFKNSTHEVFYIHPGNFQKRMCTSEYFQQLGTTTRVCSSTKMIDRTLPFVIIMDQIESYSSTEKSAMTWIVKYIKELKQKQKRRKKDKTQSTTHQPRGIRVICICQNAYIKKARDLSVLCDTLHVHPPTQETILERLTTMGGVPLSALTEQEQTRYLSNIIPDYRKLFVIPNLPPDVLYLLNPPTSRYGLHDITSRILSGLEPLSLIYHHYSIQKILLPLMIQENYRSYLQDKEDSFSSYVYEVSKNISNSSILANYTLNLNEWWLSRYHTILSCFTPSNYINNATNAQTKRSNENLKASWPAVLNRTSLQYTYKHTYYDNILDKNTYMMDRNTVRFNVEKLVRMYEIQDVNKTPNPTLHKLLSVYHIKDKTHILQIQKCI